MQIIALGLLSALLAQTPDAQGQAEFQAGHFRSAKKLFQQSVRSQSGTPQEQAAALANLAQAQLALGELAPAGDSLRRAIQLVPQSSRLWNQLGQVQFLNRRLEEAEAAQSKALLLSEKNEPKVAATVLSDLALIYEEKGKGQKAMDSLQRAASLLDPGQARARVLANLGLLRWKFGPKTDAPLYLEKALLEMEASAGKHHPDVGRILEDYAQVLAKTGQKQSAKQMAARAREIRSSALAQTNSGYATVDWRDLSTTRR